MPSNRPNLTLDQQFFQELLSAAYTIQQHNDLLDNDSESSGPTEVAEQVQATPQEHLEAQPTCACPHCGTLKASAETPCEHCTAEEFRPGERMQRKWASMWLMSQQQGLWPERSVEEGPAPNGINQNPTLDVNRSHRNATVSNLAASGILATPVDKKSPREKPPFERNEAIRGHLEDAERQSAARKNGDRQNGNGRNGRAHGDGRNGRPEVERVNGKSAIDQESFTSYWNLEKTDAASEELLPEKSERTDFAPENPGLLPHTVHESETDGALLTDTDSLYGDASEDSIDADQNDLTFGYADSGETSLLQRVTDWRVKLRFHRADLYLGLSILVAAFALLWPTTDSTQPATLSTWQRMLVAIGIAEAPPPAIHLLGDPAIEVWIDPHSALYYCPGEEQYGKTADGRFTSQHEAQTDRFEPAGRSACE